MGSKSYSTTSTDASALTVADAATGIRAEGGSTVTNTLTDFGSIDRAFSFGDQAFKFGDSSFGFGKSAIDLVGSLTKSSIAATQNVAKETTAELAGAYRDARGAMSGTQTVLMVVVVVTVIAAIVIKGR